MVTGMLSLYVKAITMSSMMPTLPKNVHLEQRRRKNCVGWNYNSWFSVKAYAVECVSLIFVCLQLSPCDEMNTDTALLWHLHQLPLIHWVSKEGLYVIVTQWKAINLEVFLEQNIFWFCYRHTELTAALNWKIFADSLVTSIIPCVHQLHLEWLMHVREALEYF